MEYWCWESVRWCFVVKMSMVEMERNVGLLMLCVKVQEMRILLECKRELCVCLAGKLRMCSWYADTPCRVRGVMLGNAHMLCVKQ